MSEELKWPDPVALDHLACIEDGELRFMSCRKAPAHDCELYAMPDGERAPDLYTRSQVLEMLASLRSELEAARGKVEAAKLPEGKWSLGHRDGNWRWIDHADHQRVMRIVWRMVDDDGPNHFLESQARAVIAALNDATELP